MRTIATYKRKPEKNVLENLLKTQPEQLWKIRGCCGRDR